MDVGLRGTVIAMTLAGAGWEERMFLDAGFVRLVGVEGHEV